MDPADFFVSYIWSDKLPTRLLRIDAHVRHPDSYTSMLSIQFCHDLICHPSQNVGTRANVSSSCLYVPAGPFLFFLSSIFIFQFYVSSLFFVS